MSHKSRESPDKNYLRKYFSKFIHRIINKARELFLKKSNKTVKIDKRIKSIIAATVLIAIVVAAPVLSSGRVALAQQPPKTGTLTLYIIENAPVRGPNCSYDGVTFPPVYCPHGRENGLVIVTINPGPQQQTKEYGAGAWQEKAIYWIDIPVGSKYTITAKVPKNYYAFPNPEGPPYFFYAFRHDSTYISPIRNGCGPVDVAKPGIAECTATMGSDGRAEIHVGFYWKSKSHE